MLLVMFEAMCWIFTNHPFWNLPLFMLPHCLPAIFSQARCGWPRLNAVQVSAVHNLGGLSYPCILLHTLVSTSTSCLWPCVIQNSQFGAGHRCLQIPFSELLSQEVFKSWKWSLNFLILSCLRQQQHSNQNSFIKNKSKKLITWLV